MPLLNSSADDYEPNLSYDGLSLHFISTRSGIGTSDIWVAQRSAIGQPWGPPQNLGMPVNQPNFANDDPALSEDGLTLFFTSNGGGAAAGGADVYFATRTAPNGTFGPPQPFAPANSSAFDHSPMVEGIGDTVYFSSTRAGGPVGGSDFYMVVRDPQTMTYSAPEPLGDLCTTGWDANATRGVTGRVYVSQFVGGNSQIVCYCARIKIVRVLRCVESWLVVVYIPPRWYIIRVWRVRWTISSITIVIYDWRRYAAGGLRALLAGFAIQNPPLDPNLIFPGSDGQIFLSGSASTLAATPIAPGQSPGLQSLVLNIPPNPALVGLQLHMQDVGLDLATTTLSVSEAGTIAIQ